MTPLIKSSERLPEFGEPSLIYCPLCYEGNQFVEGVLCKMNEELVWYITTNDDGVLSIRTTWWMPRPELPTEKLETTLYRATEE